MPGSHGEIIFSKNKPNRFVPWVHSFVSLIFHGFSKKTWRYRIFRDKPLPEVPTFWRQKSSGTLSNLFWGSTAEIFETHSNKRSAYSFRKKSFTAFKKNKLIQKNKWNSAFGTKKKHQRKPLKKKQKTCFAPQRHATFAWYRHDYSRLRRCAVPSGQPSPSQRGLLTGNPLSLEVTFPTTNLWVCERVRFFTIPKFGHKLAELPGDDSKLKIE